MRSKTPNALRLLMVLAIVCSLVGALTLSVSAAANVTISTTTGQVGQAVTINITGADPGLPVSVKFDAGTLTTSPAGVVIGSTAPNIGNAVATVVIPASPAGAHTLTVYIAAYSFPFTFTVTPSVSISPKIGSVGTVIAIVGNGFTPGVSAGVTIDSPGLIKPSLLPSGVSIIVEPDGSFEANGAIPDVTAGIFGIIASDKAGNTVTVANAITITPLLTITPNHAMSGKNVTVTGSGWPAGTVKLYIGGTATANFWADVTAAANGKISQIVMMKPSVTPGTWQVAGFGGTPPNEVSASTFFTVDPRVLIMTPLQGPIGTKVVVTGNDFTPNRDVIFFWVTPGNFWGSATTDSNGAISPTTLYIPGPQTKTGAANLAMGVDYGADGILQMIGGDDLFGYWQFMVTKPTLAVSPTTGAVGAAVTITGSGWVPNSDVSITFYGTTKTVTADSKGDIALATTVPMTATPGTTGDAVKANDAAIGNVADPVGFTLPGPTITVSPAEGTWLSEITISGSGFNRYTSIEIDINGFKFAGSLLSDSLGNFQATYMVPGVAPGSAVLTAKDGVSTATTFFVVKEAAETVKTAFAGIGSKLVRVWEYYNGAWKMYDPADAVGSDLQVMTAGRGYWVAVNANVELIYKGYKYSLTTIWNNIGWR